MVIRRSTRLSYPCRNIQRGAFTMELAAASRRKPRQAAATNDRLGDRDCTCDLEVPNPALYY